MIVSTQTITKWNSANRRHYLNYNYVFTKFNEELTVKVEHLTNYSNAIVLVECDYCGEKEFIPYVNYTSYMKKSNVKSYSCYKYECRENKVIDGINLKQQLGILKKNDRGYWSYKENRLKEVIEFLEKYKIIDIPESNKDRIVLSGSLYHYNETILGLAIELGYDIDNIITRKPDGYYNDFTILEKDIRKIIKKINRFPSLIEIYDELGISHKYLNKHGGIYKIRRKMNYEEKQDLVDESGFINNSSYELIVANYLINKKISYKREQYPFKDKNYRSDFTIFLINGESIHVEVWGYNEGTSDKRSVEYIKTKKKKEYLYLKNNIDYISIEPTIFNQRKYKNILLKLEQIFSHINSENSIIVNVEKIINYNLIADQELFNEAMKLSSDNKTFPLANNLQEIYPMLYKEILKRFDSCADFAEKFNVKSRFKCTNYWNDDRAFLVLDSMVAEHGYILPFYLIDRTNNYEYKQVSAYIRTKDNTLDIKIKYYDGIKVIEGKNKEWLIKVSKGHSFGRNEKPTQEQKEKAKQILQRITVS